MSLPATLYQTIGAVSWANWNLISIKVFHAMYGAFVAPTFKLLSDATYAQHLHKRVIASQLLTLQRLCNRPCAAQLLSIVFGLKLRGKLYNFE